MVCATETNTAACVHKRVHWGSSVQQQEQSRGFIRQRSMRRAGEGAAWRPWCLEHIQSSCCRCVIPQWWENSLQDAMQTEQQSLTRRIATLEQQARAAAAGGAGRTGAARAPRAMSQIRCFRCGQLGRYARNCRVVIDDAPAAAGDGVNWVHSLCDGCTDILREYSRPQDNGTFLAFIPAKGVQLEEIETLLDGTYPRKLRTIWRWREVAIQTETSPLVVQGATEAKCFNPLRCLAPC